MNYDYRETPEGKWRFENPEAYKKTVEFQKYLQSIGIAWHNPFADECTSDFCCCVGDGKYTRYFPSYERAFKDMLKEQRPQ